MGYSADLIGSFILAFSTRAGVDVLLMLFRTWRKRRLRFALVRHAIFGEVPLRFGAMIGEYLFGQEFEANQDRNFHFPQYLNTTPSQIGSTSIILPPPYTSWTIQ